MRIYFQIPGKSMLCKRLLGFCWSFTFCFIISFVYAQQKPIALHPENPHYFIYKGKPEILITSGEHYGAVLNLDFDYVKYLDELYSDSLNLTRTFSGTYAEPQGAFNIARNTLAPAALKFICPWQRSAEPGYANGGNKFDLSKWDTLYFKRLKSFAAAAEKRNIVVELTLFCPFYEDVQWQLSPMNAKNNVNNLGNIDRNNVYTLDKNDGLLSIQEDLTKKIVTELKDFSNIIYEICNEPYFGGVTVEWQHHFATLIYNSERDFSNQHLISQNIANGSAAITDPHPNVSVFNFHYASPPVTVAQNYQVDKVIGDNETGFRGTSDSTYRREGWQFILAGGGLYNNLDYSFTTGNEKGTFIYPSTQPGGGSKSLRKQLGYLKEFISGFDFIHMKPDNIVIKNHSPGEAKVYVLAEQGKQYAAYISRKKQATIEMVIPKGNYSIEWLNPLTGEIKKGKKISSDGKISLQLPAYKEDIALKLLTTH
ncbi:MAG TPA: putative collagen-binding domain-containing protein [Chitinophagaceae bacterium]|nr:putative collagen-binding domain-containing protein [Chitinophagaceae bacterium]